MEAHSEKEDAMKRHTISLLAVAFLMTVLVRAANKLENEKIYGGKFTDAPAVSIPDIMKNPDTYAKKEVVFEGRVNQVCQNKGCWIVVTDGMQKIRVDFKNYSFFIPWDSEGKRVRVQGKVYRKLIPKEVLKHWAQESKSPEVKPEDIKEDRVMVMVTASAVAMENGSELSKDQQEAVSGKVQKEH